MGRESKILITYVCSHLHLQIHTNLSPAHPGAPLPSHLILSPLLLLPSLPCSLPLSFSPLLSPPRWCSCPCRQEEWAWTSRGAIMSSFWTCTGTLPWRSRLPIAATVSARPGMYLFTGQSNVYIYIGSLEYAERVMYMHVQNYKQYVVASYIHYISSLYNDTPGCLQCNLSVGIPSMLFHTCVVCFMGGCLLILCKIHTIHSVNITCTVPGGLSIKLE